MGTRKVEGHVQHKELLCQICYKNRNCDTHRVIPGGEYKIDNVVSACRTCHSKIHRYLRESKTTNYRAAIEFVRAWIRDKR